MLKPAMPKKRPYPQQELANRLRSAMDDADITLTELANICGVTVQAVHDWRETGRIGKQHLMTICSVTKKPLEYFLVGLGRAASLFAVLPFIEALRACVLCQMPNRSAR